MSQFSMPLDITDSCAEQPTTSLQWLEQPAPHPLEDFDEAMPSSLPPMSNSVPTNFIEGLKKSPKIRTAPQTPKPKKTPRRRTHSVGDEVQTSDMLGLTEASISELGALGGVDGNFERPNLSYAQLAAQAIDASPAKRCTVGEIYAWIEDQYPFFKNGTPWWKNCIRHNLSMKKCFARFHNETGTNLWGIDPEHYESILSLPSKLDPSADVKSTPPRRSTMPSLSRQSSVKGTGSFRKPRSRKHSLDSSTPRPVRQSSNPQNNAAVETAPSTNCSSPNFDSTSFNNSNLSSPSRTATSSPLLTNHYIPDSILDDMYGMNLSPHDHFGSNHHSDSIFGFHDIDEFNLFSMPNSESTTTTQPMNMPPSDFDHFSYQSHQSQHSHSLPNNFPQLALFRDPHQFPSFASGAHPLPHEQHHLPNPTFNNHNFSNLTFPSAPSYPQNSSNVATTTSTSFSTLQYSSFGGPNFQYSEFSSSDFLGFQGCVTEPNDASLIDHLSLDTLDHVSKQFS